MGALGDFENRGLLFGIDRLRTKQFKEVFIIERSLNCLIRPSVITYLSFGFGIGM